LQNGTASVVAKRIFTVGVPAKWTMARERIAYSRGLGKK
jgi:hypothetical protein